MTTSDDQCNQLLDRDESPVAMAVSSLGIWPDIGIIAEAHQPGVDPCDVACDAMPGHIVGDLTPPETAWLLVHTADCGYCARMLTGYERVDDALERLVAPVAASQVIPPAPPFLPSTRRASYGTIDSPVGQLLVAVTDAGVCEIGFARSESEAEFRQRLVARGLRPVPDLTGDRDPEIGATQTTAGRVIAQLREYFEGRRERFDVPLDFAGVTPFTRAVLDATAEVPFGCLSTYRDIATRIGKPGATRAVGNALGRNPIPVIVPCHRVVRSGGSLGGYTGGVAIKERLLALEGSALVSA